MDAWDRLEDALVDMERKIRSLEAQQEEWKREIRWLKDRVTYLEAER